MVHTEHSVADMSDKSLIIPRGLEPVKMAGKVQKSRKCMHGLLIVLSQSEQRTILFVGCFSNQIVTRPFQEKVCCWVNRLPWYL